MVKIILVVLGLLLFVSSTLILGFGGKQICEKGLCVDGEGDINLEGIMCNKCEAHLFGLNSPWDIILGSLLVTLSVLSFIFTLFQVGKFGDEE